MSGTIVLETHRLLLRRYNLADAPFVFEMFSDEYARRFYPHMVGREHAEAWVRRNIEMHDRCGVALWAVVLASNGEFIGDCGLSYQSVDGARYLEIGYHVTALHRRNGYATEAARACLDYAWKHGDDNEVVSIVHPQNDASNTVASRVHDAVRAATQDGEQRNVYYTSRRGVASTSLATERTMQQ